MFGAVANNVGTAADAPLALEGVAVDPLDPPDPPLLHAIKELHSSPTPKALLNILPTQNFTADAPKLVTNLIKVYGDVTTLVNIPAV